MGHALLVSINRVKDTLIFFYFGNALSDMIFTSLLLFLSDFAKTENNGRKREAGTQCWY
jgi:hypothetical protein